MKSILVAAFTLFTAATVFSSCKKQYICDCTDNHGVKMTYSVTATNKVDANRNCDEKSILGNCSLR